MIHICLFQIAFLCQSNVYLQETLLWLLSMYMECNMSYVSLKCTKGKENLAAGPLSYALLADGNEQCGPASCCSSCCILCRNALSLILGKQQEPSDLIYGLSDFSIWPHLSYALLSASWSLCHTQLLASSSSLLKTGLPSTVLAAV